MTGQEPVPSPGADPEPGPDAQRSGERLGRRRDPSRDPVLNPGPLPSDAVTWACQVLGLNEEQTAAAHAKFSASE